MTTITVSPPSGHQAGDLLILLANGWASAGTTVATPSGWTLMSGGDSGGWGASSAFRDYVFYRLAASSSEPTVSVVQAASGFPEANMFAYQGSIDQTTPVDASGGWGAPDTDTTIPVPAVTTTVANALVVYFAVVTANLTGSTPPNSATQQYSSTFFNSRFLEADVAAASPGTLAASNYTLTSNTSQFTRGFAFAIRPVAAAGATFVPQVIAIT